MRYSRLTSMEQVSFKDRNRKKIKKVNLVYGDTGFIVLKNTQFEYAYFYLIRRYLKYFFKFKYAFGNYFKVWVFLKSNYPISRKSKNSRMGKGKGSFVGWLVKLNHGHTFMELNNVNTLRVSKLVKYWNRLLKVKVVIYRK